MSDLNSFRDPRGFCITVDRKLLRVVTLDALNDLEKFLKTAIASEYVRRERLIKTRKLTESEFKVYEQEFGIGARSTNHATSAIFEHDKIDFPSYPYEWPPEMLAAAARLTLQLARESLEENFGLKDATPYNILFRGSTPVFIDLLSFEQRDARDPLWKPYAQFMRTFILPLLVNKRWGIRMADVFLSRRDGLEPEEVYRMCGKFQRLLPPFLTSVTFPVWLASRARKESIYEPKTVLDPERSRFILKSLFRRLERTLHNLSRPQRLRSTWSRYMETHAYSKANFSVKEDFVRRFLQDARPKKVLDVGANSGHFSFLATESGASVVAIDADPVCVGRIWQKAFAQNKDILPLVIDINRPSPALGWRNGEHLGFLTRAAGAFDAVLMLAVLHHLTIAERVPLDAALQMVAGLTTDWLVIEFVGPTDEMVRRLFRGRDNLYAHTNAISFETVIRKYFEIVRSQQLPDTDRWLYLLRKRKD